MAMYAPAPAPASPVGTCATCAGKGHVQHLRTGELIACPGCEGFGRVRVVEELPDGPPPVAKPRPDFAAVAKRLRATLARLCAAEAVFRAELSPDAYCNLRGEAEKARRTLEDVAG